ncbi:MAG: large conductance mechanosensitive channel protein MscL [Anaerolineales bacterium]
MFAEFKKFALRGNVMDLAIGVILGAAFGKIVTSFVNDLLMPPLGLLLGGVDFTNRFITLKGETFATLADAQANGAVTLNYGLFLNNVLDFLIVAFVIFLMVRWINRLSEKPQPAAAPAAPTTKTCPHCQMDIPIKAVRCPHCTSQI